LGARGAGYRFARAAGTHRLSWWAAALALPTHALLPIIAAVRAAATVPFASLKVDTAALAAGLLRTTTVGAAATVALVGLKVDAPISAASLPFGAPVGGPGYPWNGG
jgi:hypothetical protein